MAAATAKKLWDFRKEGFHFEGAQLPMLLVGNVIAFVVAMIAIRTFIQYLQRHSFRAFGVYRIIAGAAILALIYLNVIVRH